MRINISSIKNFLANGVSIGSLSGFIIGMGINNKISLEVIDNKQKISKYYRIPNLIVTTVIGGLITPILFIFKTY